MKRWTVSFLALYILSFSLPVAQAHVMPNVTPTMLQADFWINKLHDPGRILMDNNEILAFNKQTAALLPDKVYNLGQYPVELARETLIGLIAVPDSLEKSRYVNSRLVTTEYYQSLTAQCNLSGIAPVTPVRYGFTVTRANMRTFPTADSLTSQPGDSEFDLMQETAVDPAEPLVILHESADRAWYFVQIVNYRGWLPVSSVAVAANRQQWIDYEQTTEVLTVIAKKLTIDGREFAMGAKLRLVGSSMSPSLSERMAAGGKYAVSLPVRGPKGELAFELAAIASDDQVVRGTLPFTRANILRQVFKLEGERYGWGGLRGGWDCSSLVLDVYRSFGIMLPRNADEQELAAGRTVNFAAGNRQGVLRSLEPGAAVYLPGHTMIYLGEEDGLPYTIHALGGYSTPGGRVPVMRVVVSDLSLALRSGTTFLNALTVGKQIL